jgi:hypothetical protein
MLNLSYMSPAHMLDDENFIVTTMRSNTQQKRIFTTVVSFCFPLSVYAINPWPAAVDATRFYRSGGQCCELYGLPEWNFHLRSWRLGERKSEFEPIHASEGLRPYSGTGSGTGSGTTCSNAGEWTLAKPQRSPRFFFEWKKRGNW